MGGAPGLGYYVPGLQGPRRAPHPVNGCQGPAFVCQEGVLSDFLLAAGQGGAANLATLGFWPAQGFFSLFTNTAVLDSFFFFKTKSANC